jgi:hypothetical protein
MPLIHENRSGIPQRGSLTIHYRSLGKYTVHRINRTSSYPPHYNLLSNRWTFLETWTRAADSNMNLPLVNLYLEEENGPAAYQGDTR